MIVYTVTKIFGVDAVKTRVFYNEADAKTEIEENLFLCSDDNTKITVRETEDGIYYIINSNDKTDPTEYIEFVLRRCEIK